MEQEVDIRIYKIKYLISQKKIKATDIAERLNVTRATIYNWLNGSILPDGVIERLTQAVLDILEIVELPAIPEAPPVIVVDQPVRRAKRVAQFSALISSVEKALYALTDIIDAENITRDKIDTHLRDHLEVDHYVFAKLENIDNKFYFQIPDVIVQLYNLDAKLQVFTTPDGLFIRKAKSDDDWRKELLKALKRGLITPEQLEDFIKKHINV